MGRLFGGSQKVVMDWRYDQKKQRVRWLTKVVQGWDMDKGLGCLAELTGFSRVIFIT